MPKHFFLIDDDQDDIDFFKEAVLQIDPEINCAFATDGEQGLEKLKSGGPPPDYIFLDLNMPRLNGKEFLKLAKNDPAISDIPIIIYSTSGIDADKQETLALGASGFIVKPTSFGALVKEIEAVIA